MMCDSRLNTLYRSEKQIYTYTDGQMAISVLKLNIIQTSNKQIIPSISNSR